MIYELFFIYRHLNYFKIGITKNNTVGTSLAVQLLRRHAPIAGGLGSIPGKGIRFHMTQLKTSHAATRTQ